LEENKVKSYLGKKERKKERMNVLGKTLKLINFYLFLRFSKPFKNIEAILDDFACARRTVPASTHYLDL